MNEPSRYHQTKEQIATEFEVILLAKKDPSHFKSIYDNYFGDILNFIHLRLDDKQMAIDLTQQTFLKALSGIQSYENRGVPFSGWLCRIASNELNEVFRKNSKHRAVNLTEGIIASLRQEVLDDDPNDWIVKLRQVIRKLKETDFRIIEMRFFENRPFAEIGEILEITENNAKVKTYRILERMKEMLLQLA